MRILADTNILLRAIQRKHPTNPIAISALKALHRQGHILYVMPQNLIEFWNVCTRPANVNGLGLSVTIANRLISRFERTFFILPDALQIFYEWRTLVVQYNVIGTSVHDARLVAAMKVHGINRILTFDIGDFSRYAGIEVLHPQAVLGGS